MTLHDPRVEPLAIWLHGFSATHPFDAATPERRDLCRAQAVSALAAIDAAVSRVESALPADFHWESNDDYRRARADTHACAYNAFVNSNSGRGVRKMHDLGRALNYEDRVLGRVKLDALVAAGIIEGYVPCPAECLIYPGGLRHVDGCENDFNHPVYRARVDAAMEMLPGGKDGFAGRRAAYVHLVGNERAAQGDGW